MRRQAEAALEHAREVVFRQGTKRGQLAQRQWRLQMLLDELTHTPALQRCQATLEAQALAQANLVE